MSVWSVITLHSVCTVLFRLCIIADIFSLAIFLFSSISVAFLFFFSFLFFLGYSGTKRMA